MRTREQIIADCEKRFRELEREAEKPERKYPCETCRWKTWRWKSLREGPTCNEPLVKGLSDTGKLMGHGKTAQWLPSLCGPEKALWQPKLTICERILKFLRGDAA